MYFNPTASYLAWKEYNKITLKMFMTIMIMMMMSHGDDQAPADGCHCKPMIKKLEVQLKATKKEMRSHILTVQEQVDCRLGRMDSKCKHQVRLTHQRLYT